MAEKTLPFTREKIEHIVRKYPTPFHIYDEKGMRDNARRLVKAFSWAPGFREFFAVKACPNPYIMKILREEGFGADCSSLAELVLAERAGITGENISFSSNDTPGGGIRQGARSWAPSSTLTTSAISPFWRSTPACRRLISFRYNPGPLRGGNAIIGHPEEAKYGFTREQLFEGYRTVRDRGVKRFGLHTMVASNELNPDYFVDTADMLFDLVVEIHRELGIRFEFVNLGGGFGIPYRPEEKAIDMEYVSGQIRNLYDKKIQPAGLHPLKIFMESGRMITGPYGYLVSRVLHMKNIYKSYVGLDACMANLMRPAIYGAYHHITVLGKEGRPHDRRYDVTGSLCENNDKFAIDRMLPEIEIGDIVVIHDTGAHGHAMGFNYNGKLRSAELLLKARRLGRADTAERKRWMTISPRWIRRYRLTSHPVPLTAE